MSQLPPDSSNSSSKPGTGIKQQADNTSMGNGMQAIQGDGNVQVQGDNNSVFNYFQNLFLGKQELHLSRPRNEQLLLTKVKHEVASRLKQSLHDAVLINLGKEEQPEQVSPPLEAEIKIGSKPGRDLSDETAILQVFDREDVAGRLLILGQPGSGKTTTLLELARSLANRAGQDFEYPIPVLFNLSSWRDTCESIPDWIIEELKSKYGVRKDIGKLWVEEKRLLPLLDGLDEVKVELQDLCVKTINRWLGGEDRTLYAVICSRSEEYKNYESILELNGAILLKTLTGKQVQQYLINANRIEFWKVLQEDEKLFELSHTPLWISIIVLSYRELPLGQWQGIVSTQKILGLLLNVYVQRMLHREIRSGTYTNQKIPSAEQTRHWLIFLAQQLQQESQTEFLIEKMQHSYLTQNKDRIIYLCFDYLLSVLAGNPGYKLVRKLSKRLGFSRRENLIYQFFIRIIPSSLRGFIELADVLIRYLVSNPLLDDELRIGIVAILFAEIRLNIDKNELNLIIDEVEIFDYIEWSFNIRSFIVKLTTIIALVYTLEIFLKYYSSSSIIFSGVFWGFIYGFWLSLYTSLSAKLSTSDIQTRKSLFSTIRSSLINSLIFSSLFGLAFWLYIGIASGFLLVLYFHIEKGLVVGLLLGGFLGLRSFVELLLDSGGKSIIQHYILCFLLVRRGKIPWNYARFLDYCTERLILQRVGGRYRLIHKLLQDHFANMELK